MVVFTFGRRRHRSAASACTGREPAGPKSVHFGAAYLVVRKKHTPADPTCDYGSRLGRPTLVQRLQVLGSLRLRVRDAARRSAVNSPYSIGDSCKSSELSTLLTRCQRTSGSRPYNDGPAGFCDAQPDSHQPRRTAACRARQRRPLVLPDHLQAEQHSTECWNIAWDAFTLVPHRRGTARAGPATQGLAHCGLRIADWKNRPNPGLRKIFRLEKILIVCSAENAENRREKE